jgi:S1-C subfamily serine protease
VRRLSLAFACVLLVGAAPPRFGEAVARLDADVVALDEHRGPAELDALVDDAIVLSIAAGPGDARAEASSIVNALVHLAHTQPTGGRDVEGAGRWLIDALPDAARPLRTALLAAPWPAIAALPADVDPDAIVARLAAAGVRVNRRIAALDELDPPVAAAVRAVQPAMARVIGEGEGKVFAGTGVNVAPEGLVLTNAHLAERPGATMIVEFPDGSRYRGTCVEIDPRRDLALLSLDGAVALPTARLAEAPPKRHDPVVLIGGPGGGAFPPFRVIAGTILDIRDGAVAHDAPTEWGNSGTPLLDASGRIVALHNAYDDRTAIRYAVPWEALRDFLDHTAR